MPTYVVQRVHRLVVVPNDDHRGGADLYRHVVTGIGDLGLRSTEEPVLAEDGIKVEVVDVRVGVEGRLEAEAGFATSDQLLDVDGRDGGSGLTAHVVASPTFGAAEVASHR